MLSRWYPYQVLIWTWYCTHKYVTTLRHPGEGPPIQTEKLNIQNLEIKIQIGQHFHSGDHWPPGPRRRVISFCCGLSAGCSSSHIKPFMENVGQRSPVSHRPSLSHCLVLVTLIGRNLSSDIYFISFSSRPLKISFVSTRVHSWRQSHFGDEEIVSPSLSSLSSLSSLLSLSVQTDRS